MFKYSELVGVVGGLGPKASAQFYDEYLINGRVAIQEALIKSNNVKTAQTKLGMLSHSLWTKEDVEKMMKLTSKQVKDQDHPPFIMFNACHIADRNEYLLGKSTDSPVTEAVDVVRRLTLAGATKICFTCNTIHYFLPEIQAELQALGVKVEFLNMIELTLKYIFREIKPKNKVKIGLLSTEVTAKTGVYESVTKSLGDQFSNVSYLTPNEEGIKRVMKVIYGVKAGETDIEEKKGLEHVLSIISELKQLKARNCIAAILGCTEVAVALSKKNLEYLADNFDKPEVGGVGLNQGLIREDILEILVQEEMKIVNPGIVLADEVLRLTLVSRT